VAAGPSHPGAPSRIPSPDRQIWDYNDGRTEILIDCVLERPDRRLLAIEIKLAMSVNEADFRHLRAMRERQGDRFVCGVVFHCGSQVVPFGDRLLAVPASALWGGVPLPASLSR